ncbi:epidermal growth factor-like protein 6 [Ornithorhynchus anatinus]|uniref:EGF like domain multiple 6 n=1 Tax=Ornithorhynchus anatinus TaxID=9258 RepID=F7E136_ORNAN|nr:epidermal growth factor-like protein 6 [Ornithorhynchus anatinus]
MSPEPGGGLGAAGASVSTKDRSPVPGRSPGEIPVGPAGSAPRSAMGLGPHASSLRLWLGLWLALGAASSSRGHRPLTFTNQPGVCHYGTTLECCFGWRKNNKGYCEAICEPACKHGECVGPNKCKCFPGFTGKACHQDMNECGLKPRPCEHRCMNTHGSYKCYCLNGYMLLPDGTCANSRSCAMSNCQYGCEVTKEEVRCLCPSTGLQLGPNGRTCLDIDECSTGKAMCPFNRRCVNTFGSYYCKCQIGYELKYTNRRYDCVDINECSVTTQECSLHAECLNTQGSFKCKCKQGYRGNGFECSVIPENSVKEVLRVPGVVKDTIKKLLAHKNSEKKNEEIKNAIPEPPNTPAPKVHLQPFDDEEGPFVDGSFDGKDKESEEPRRREEEEEKDQEDLENQVDHEQTLRGDVFFPKVEEAAAFGPLLVQRKESASKSVPRDFNISLDCTFEQGICDWKQDTEDDFDWTLADRDNANGYYMAVPATVGHKNDVGRLKLLLTNLQPKSSFCLLFDYLLAGDRVGSLRVFLESSNNVPAWEQTGSQDGRWRTGAVELPQGIDKTQRIIFESERGKSKTGEIGIGAVFLISGFCPEDLLSADI